jgi:hypothetical protein
MTSMTFGTGNQDIGIRGLEQLSNRLTFNTITNWSSKEKYDKIRYDSIRKLLRCSMSINIANIFGI